MRLLAPGSSTNTSNYRVRLRPSAWKPYQWIGAPSGASLTRYDAERARGNHGFFRKNTAF